MGLVREHRRLAEQLEPRAMLTGVAFSAPIDISEPQSGSSLVTYRVEVLDLDGDGSNDILRQEHPRRLAGGEAVTWHLNREDGFEVPVTLELGNFNTVLIGDVDGDGAADLVGVPGSNQEDIVWFANEFDEGGSFREQPLPVTGIERDVVLAVELVDLNADTRADLIYRRADSLPSEPRATTFGWYQNLGNQDWVAHDLLETGFSGSAQHELEVVDFDLDGDSDIFAIRSGYRTGPSFVEEDDELLFFENTGNQFAEPVRHTYPHNTVGGQFVDLDEDGDIDLVSGDRRSLEWMENVDGLLREQTTIREFESGEPGTPEWFVFPYDVDSDGTNELVFHSDGNYMWFEDALANSFTEGRSSALNRLQAIGDIDGDGDEDIVEVNGENVRWYDSVMVDSDEYVVTSTDLEDVRKFQPVDVDGDGDEDAVVVSRETLVWYENEGGGFGPLQTLGGTAPTGDVTSLLIVVDLNSDGLEDFVVRYHEPTTQMSSVVVFYNVGGSISEPVLLPAIDRPEFLDINGDGDPELLDTENHQIRLNNGTGQFR